MVGEHRRVQITNWNPRELLLGTALIIGPNERWGRSAGSKWQIKASPCRMWQRRTAIEMNGGRQQWRSASHLIMYLAAPTSLLSLKTFITYWGAPHSAGYSLVNGGVQLPIISWTKEKQKQLAKSNMEKDTPQGVGYGYHETAFDKADDRHHRYHQGTYLSTYIMKTHPASICK